MKCKMYEKYELEELTEKEFFIHMESCAECRDAFNKDELLLQAAKQLNRDSESPDLWQSIKDSLEKENQSINFNIIHYFSRHKNQILQIAAILLISISASLFMLFKPESEIIDTSRILEKSALENVIEKEQNYMAAIDVLEKSAAKKLPLIDENLVALYENKIRVIDQQIAKCRDALETNPGNTHIRKYLFAVLKDKKNTLEEIISYSI